MREFIAHRSPQTRAGAKPSARASAASSPRPPPASSWRSALRRSPAGNGASATEQKTDRRDPAPARPERARRRHTDRRHADLRPRAGIPPAHGHAGRSDPAHPAARAGPAAPTRGIRERRRRICAASKPSRSTKSPRPSSRRAIIRQPLAALERGRAILTELFKADPNSLEFRRLLSPSSCCDRRRAFRTWRKMGRGARHLRRGAWIIEKLAARFRTNSYSRSTCPTASARAPTC